MKDYFDQNLNSMSSRYKSKYPVSKDDLKKNRGYVKSSILIIAALFSALLSRLLDTMGFPSTINFLHFITIPFVFLITLSKTKTREREQLNNVLVLITLLSLFFSIILISSILNKAGAINGVLAFLLWGEPFLLLISILCLPNRDEVFSKIRKCITYAMFFHTFLAFVQHYLLRLYRLGGAADNIQGIFYRSGAGHVVGASIALTFGIYFLVSAKHVALHFRILFLLAAFWHMVLADAKQVLLSLIIGGILLLITKFKNITEALKYLAIAIVLGLVLAWCIENLDAFRAFKTWIRPEIYGSDGEATLLKSASFRLIPTFYESPLNWLFGLGPGHTVDRLGGWMLPQYSSLLKPLGATIHPASQEIWFAVGSSWLGDQSSMFSPLFGWAALWGDFGFIGLISYLAIGIFIYAKICVDDISKLMLFSVFAVGWVFSQMQEPGYMLTIAALVGLNWHEKKFEIAKNIKSIRFRET